MPRPPQESGVTSLILGSYSPPRMLLLPSQNSSFSDHCMGTPFAPLPGQVHALPQCSSVCNGQSPFPFRLLDHWCTWSCGSLVVLQLLYGHAVGQLTQSLLVTASFVGKTWPCLVSIGSYGCWMVAGIVSVHQQCYWILKCLTTVGATLGAKFSIMGLGFLLYQNLSHALGPWNWRH